MRIVGNYSRGSRITGTLKEEHIRGLPPDSCNEIGNLFLLHRQLAEVDEAQVDVSLVIPWTNAFPMLIPATEDDGMLLWVVCAMSKRAKIAQFQCLGAHIVSSCDYGRCVAVITRAYLCPTVTFTDRHDVEHVRMNPLMHIERSINAHGERV